MRLPTLVSSSPASIGPGATLCAGQAIQLDPKYAKAYYRCVPTQPTLSLSQTFYVLTMSRAAGARRATCRS